MLSSCSLRFVKSGVVEEDELMKEAAQVSRQGSIEAFLEGVVL